MKVVFVDAENIGLQSIKDIDVRITDKVFVFSNSENVKKLCHDLMFIVMDGYPAGKNQADFYIISYLSKALSQINQDEKMNITFSLCSNDHDLCQAFEFQCQLTSIQCVIVRPMQGGISYEIQGYTATELNNIALVYRTLKARSMTVSELFKITKLSQSDSTKSLNALVNKKLISRSHNNKKVWDVVSELKPELFA